MFIVGDSSGSVRLWATEGSISSWRQVTAKELTGETFLSALFLARLKNLQLHEELKDSSLYSEKFSSQ